MSVNLCVESRLRDAVETGFTVTTVPDVTAAAGEDAINTALTNFIFIAQETPTTDEDIERLTNADSESKAAETTA